MEFPYLSRLEIENYRNLAKFEVDLKPTTVIVGANTSGKTNLLQALRLVLDPSLPDADRYLRAEDFWDGLKEPFAGNIVRVRVHIRGFKNDKNTKPLLYDCIVEKAPLTARLTYEFRPKKNIAPDQQGEDSYEFVVYGGHDEKHRVGAEVRRWLSLVVLPALRDAEGEMRAWKRSPLTPLLERARLELSQGRAEAIRDKLDEATQLLLEQPPVKELQRQTNKRLADLIGPIHEFATELSFVGTKPEQLFRSLRLYVRERQTRPLSDASLGTANVLFLSLLLQDLDARRDADDIASAVLGIEEPEAHLHPHLQRLLFRHFLRRKHAVMVTTHSPHLASVAPLPSLLVLRCGKQGTKPYNLVGLGLEADKQADLERYLDVTRAEMLFAKGVVFVEGAAERFLVPTFASCYLENEKLARNLDDLGISVCSVEGTDFLPYVRAASKQGWAIPHIVITDGDFNPKEKKRARYQGCLRGLALLGEDTEQLALLLDNGSAQKVRTTLRERGIFVGGHTLEIDLIRCLAEEITETYAELRQSSQGSHNFNSIVEKLKKDVNDAEARSSYITRIERVGKGRFAQRLAGKIKAAHSPPPYISEAIQHIVSRVRREDA